MAIQDTDLLYVQRPSGPDAGAYKIEYKDMASGNITTGDTPPDPAADGDLWYNSNDGRLYVYYTDADSSQWVDASPDNQSWILSVKDFGAKGDGSTDDTDAIQLAIDTCVADERALYIPAGKYIIRKTLVIPPSSIKITGDGITSELAMRPGTFEDSPFNPGTYDSVFIQLGNSTEVSYSPIIRDLLLSAPQSLQGSNTAGLMVARCSQGVFENVRFQGFYSALQLYAVARSFVNHCTFHTGGRTVAANNAIRIDNINNNEFNCTGLHITNIEIHSGFQGEHGWLEGITMLSCDGCYIANSHIIGTRNHYNQEVRDNSVIGAIRFVNTYFDQFYNVCVLVSTSDNPQVLGENIKSNDLVFSSCYFRGGQPGATNHVLVSNDRDLATQKQIKFVGCDFASVNGAAIKIPKSTSTQTLICTGNFFRDCNYDGNDRADFIDGAAILSVISNNIFDSANNGGAAADGYAVYLDNLNDADQTGSTFNITGNHAQASADVATDTGKNDFFIRVAGMGANANRSGFVKENNSWSVI